MKLRLIIEPKERRQKDKINHEDIRVENVETGELVQRIGSVDIYDDCNSKNPSRCTLTALTMEAYEYLKDSNFDVLPPKNRAIEIDGKKYEQVEEGDVFAFTEKYGDIEESFNFELTAELCTILNNYYINGFPSSNDIVKNAENLGLSDEVIKNFVRFCKFEKDVMMAREGRPYFDVITKEDYLGKP